MTLDELLAPVDPMSPAGPDLSYDPDRYQIEQAFDAAASGEDVDWRDTIRRVEAQSQRTKDVWLAVALARAGARAGRLDTVELGLSMLAGLFERYWDMAHPLVEEYGLQGRKGPCESLTRLGEFLLPLRRTVLVAHSRFGSFSGEDVIRLADEGEGADGYGQFRAALAETPVETLRDEVARFDRLRAALERVDALLTERAAAAGETGTNFQPAYAAVDDLRRALASFVGADEPGSSEAAAVAGEGPAAAASPAASATPRRIESREDVGRALDAITDYYERREPSSPIPVALRRVKGWITMDFLAILKDIAPNGMTDANAVLTARKEEENSNTW